MMNENKTEHRARFERQRRNLILASVVVGTYVVFGLKLEVINVLGNSFKVSSPAGVELAIWTLLIYFLVRYFQYYQVCDNGEFKNKYNEFMFKGVKKEAQRIFQDFDVKQRRIDNPEGSLFEYTFNKNDVMESHKNRWELMLSGNVSWKLPKGSGSVGFSDVPITISGNKLWRRKVSAYFKVYCFTPHFTEYMFPYCLAGFVLVWKIFTS